MSLSRMYLFLPGRPVTVSTARFVKSLCKKTTSLDSEWNGGISQAVQCLLLGNSGTGWHRFVWFLSFSSFTPLPPLGTQNCQGLQKGTGQVNALLPNSTGHFFLFTVNFCCCCCCYRLLPITYSFFHWSCVRNVDHALMWCEVQSPAFCSLFSTVWERSLINKETNTQYQVTHSVKKSKR